MSRTKIAITLDQDLLQRVDALVSEETYPSRSRAIELAVAEKLDRDDKNRLARECAKLDPAQERELADAGLASDLSEWPEY